MKLHRSAPFLRAYGLLPHRLLNRAAGRLARLRRPRWAVQAAIRTWTGAAGIDRGEYEDRAYETVHDFFLRRLRPGARPLGPGFVSPVDGRLFGRGSICGGTMLQVKGRPISVERLVNGRLHDLSLSGFEGGSYVTIFLTPSGYHRIHMPEEGEIVDCRWIPGRFFPQNEDAIHHVRGIYERNERAVLRYRRPSGEELLLVLVGASLVGGIHLEGLPRKAWVRREPTPIGRIVNKGDEIGHFAFGSTIVLLLPSATDVIGADGDWVRMGETLLR